MRRIFTFILLFVIIRDVSLLRGQEQGQEPRKEDGQHSTEKPVRYTLVPYTAKSMTANLQTKTSGESVDKVLEVEARDSQGRLLHSTMNMESKFRSYQVDDPVSGTKIVWTTSSNELKKLKWPTAVPGRKSCWQMPPEAILPGGPQMGVRGMTCGPAGKVFSPRCDGGSTAAPLPEKEEFTGTVTFEDCKRGLESIRERGEKEARFEDLGEERMLGQVAHGCRKTAESNDGIIIREDWEIAFGREHNSVRLSARQTIEKPSNALSYKVVREVTSLKLAEPDSALFQPPKNYKTVNFVMHEVPCGQ